MPRQTHFEPAIDTQYPARMGDIYHCLSILETKYWTQLYMKGIWFCGIVRPPEAIGVNDLVEPTRCHVDGESGTTCAYMHNINPRQHPR